MYASAEDVSFRVADSRSWQTEPHAFIQHPNIMIKGIEGRGPDLQILSLVPRFLMRALRAPHDLHIPYKQQVFQDLVLQPILYRRVSEELQCVVDLLGIKLGRIAFAES